MSQGEGKRAIKSCEESEATLKILVGREAYHLSEQWYDDAHQSQQYDGYHQSLHQQYPVVGIGGTRIGQEGHTTDEGGKDGDAHCPRGNLTTSSKIL